METLAWPGSRSAGRLEADKAWMVAKGSLRNGWAAWIMVVVSNPNIGRSTCERDICTGPAPCIAPSRPSTGRLRALKGDPRFGGNLRQLSR